MVQIEEVEEAPPKQGCAYCSEPTCSKVCSLCRDVSYCSKGCQQAHWKAHRKECARKYEPKPKEAPKIENPCVRCGKQGLHESSGSWYCSHECCSGNVNDLTAQIKQLTTPKESHAAKELSRLKDFITSSTATPAKEVKPQVKDPNEHIRKLIESQNQKAGAGEPEEGSGDRAAQPPHERKARGAAAAKEPKCPILQKMEEQQQAAKKLEKAKKEQQRFTEWVQWAHVEIQKKKEQEEEDDDGA